MFIITSKKTDQLINNGKLMIKVENKSNVLAVLFFKYLKGNDRIELIPIDIINTTKVPQMTLYGKLRILIYVPFSGFLAKNRTSVKKRNTEELTIHNI